MHFVFKTAVRCGGSQMIERGTRVANIGDFSPKNFSPKNFRDFLGLLGIKRFSGEF
jgi:hypothetical protein